MSYDLDPLVFDFTPTLKTREKIQATASFVVGGGVDYTLSLFVPWLSLTFAVQEVRDALYSEATAIANRWALQFPSADAAMDLKAYRSLTAQLSAIASDQFIIKKVIVRQIIPITPPIPSTPEPPKADTRTHAEKIITELNERVSTIEELRKYEAESRKTYPDLWAHPAHGPAMERMFFNKRASILRDRGTV